MTIEQRTSSAPQPVYRDQHPSGPLPSAEGWARDRAPMSGFAVSSLVWSLVGLVTFGLAAVGGAICGHLALQELRLGGRRGHELAVAGLIISWVQIIGWLLFGLVMLVVALLGAANL